MMKSLFFLLAIFNALLASAAQITGAIDRNPVSLNESFQLTYTASATPDGSPDFELIKRHFDILNQSHSSEVSLINGKSTSTIKWTLQLMAKEAGEQVIPGIAFGSDNAQPIPVMVTPSKTNNDVNTNEDLLLKVEASPLKPYVQSQVLYTLRLFRKIDIAQARLDEPKLADAVIQKLGEDRNYNTQINGVDYVVTERQYAIFPQKSGTVNIAPLTLTAEVVTDSFPRFNGFFNQQSTRTQKIASNAVTLEVRPAPSTVQMPHWIPAEDLQLKQEWSGDAAKMKVGEPLTRTLMVVAKGATVGLLPELNGPSPDQQLKTYPDQPVIKEMQKPEGIYALREEKVAIIPSRAGTFTLPAIEVPWFNVQTEKTQVAKIPAVTLTVLPANGTTATPPPPTPSVAAPATVPTQQSPLQTAPMPQTNQWMWVSLFLGLGWLSTLVYFLMKRRPAETAKTTDSTPPPIPNNFAPQLKQACQNNDMQQAKQALLQWGRAEYQVTSLGALADHCDARLRDEIQLLNQLLYAQQDDLQASAPQQWQGKRLLQAFSEQHATHKMHPANKEDGLEPLYRL